MDVLKAISDRRSHRSYRKEQVPEDVLGSVLKAGLEGYEEYMKRVKYRMIPLIW